MFTPKNNQYITHVGGSDSGYVFTTRDRIGGFDSPTSWHLWYLNRTSGEPMLIDESDNEGLPSPTFAISERHIVWTAFHGTGDTAVNELRILDIDVLQEPRTLLSYPAYDTSLWLPVLSDDELWYGVNRNDWTAGTVHPRVEMIDLNNPQAQPVPYGEDVRAFMPAVNDQVVVWKGGGDDTLAAFNAGQPYLYWRADATIESIRLPGYSWDRISFPSVGDRFVAWWSEYATSFYVYDLRERAVRAIAEYEPTGPERILMPSVSGSLIAYIYARGERYPLELRWAYLPE